MADKRIVLASKTLQAALNEFLLTQEITENVGRSYSILPDDLPDCGTRIDVVPSPKVVTTLECLGDGDDSSKCGYAVEIDIIVRRKFEEQEKEGGKPTPEAIDDLVSLVETIHDYTIGRDLSTGTFGVKWKETRFIAAYDPRLMRTSQFFRGGVRVTFTC